MRKTLALTTLLLAIAIATPALAADLDQPVTEADLVVDGTDGCQAPATAVEAERSDSLTDLESDLLAPAMGGEPCNETVCEPSEFCCNFSCSICAPRGGSCIQIICD